MPEIHFLIWRDKVTDFLEASNYPGITPILEALHMKRSEVDNEDMLAIAHAKKVGADESSVGQTSTTLLNLLKSKFNTTARSRTDSRHIAVYRTSMLQRQNPPTW